MERIIAIFIFCFALSFWIMQCHMWERALSHLQQEIELEQDIGVESSDIELTISGRDDNG